MERSSDQETCRNDGTLTPPLSTDSSLAEMIEAELRTRLVQDQEQETTVSKEHQQQQDEQEEAVVTKTSSGCVSDHLESTVSARQGAAEEPAPAAHMSPHTEVCGEVIRSESAEVTEVTEVQLSQTASSSDVTEQSQASDAAPVQALHETAVYKQASDEPASEQTAPPEASAPETPNEISDPAGVVTVDHTTELGRDAGVESTGTAHGGLSLGAPDELTNNEIVSRPPAEVCTGLNSETTSESAVENAVTDANSHTIGVDVAPKVDIDATAEVTSASDSNLHHDVSGPDTSPNPEVSSDVMCGVEPESTVQHSPVVSPDPDVSDSLEADQIEPATEPATSGDADPTEKPVYNGAVLTEPSLDGDAAHVEKPVDSDITAIEKRVDSDIAAAEQLARTYTAPTEKPVESDAALTAKLDEEVKSVVAITAPEPASKISDEDSDEGVEDGKSSRSTDAKKLRRKKKSDSEKDSGHMGTSRTTLDSEGDSDISSEGSSGASSLPRSQDSGAAPGRARLSESSEPEHDDELANVNLRQLRSSYLTNFESTKLSALPSNMPDTGVSIKNLKNTYAGQPVPAPRGSSSGDTRPRDMSKITVNMASLRSVYSSPDRSKAPSSPKTDVPAGLSLPSIRAAYVQQAQGQAQAGSPALEKAGRPVQTGVSIDKLRSSFGKVDHASENTRIHVRSFDSSKAMKRFNSESSDAAGSDCRACGRRVYQMERISAEKAVWHKNCFRCGECAKQMTVDTYASDEGRLYCPVHHRQLMKDRAAHHAEDTVARTPTKEREPAVSSANMPEHLEETSSASDVVRASNKADYGLEDLQNLNVKDRFSVFERSTGDDQEREPANVEVKRSQSILNKMKKFQERRDGGSSGDESSSEASGDEQHRDPDLVRSQRKYKKERPMSFSGLGDVKSRFENGVRREQPVTPAEETKGELAKLRGMICGGTLRASYERAVQESGSPRPPSRQTPEDGLTRGRAADMTSRFESGAVSLTAATVDDDADEPHHNGADAAQQSVEEESQMEETDAVRTANPESELAADPELLHSDTTKRMLNKFKQMEQNSGKPDEEVNVCREVAHGNARQVLSKFRQIQENALKDDLPGGPPPPKSFTPPPEEPTVSDPEEADEEVADDPDIIKASQKVPDEFLSKRTDQARSLRDKFESWEPRPDRDGSFNVEDDCKPSLEITRNMRAKFESMQTPQSKPVEKTPQKASRFIMESPSNAEMCGACDKRVYAMERLEVDKRILHKNCFRCSKCNCVLRMDTYTFNAGKLFCTPHFKQMFKTKGNYDEGFGLESRTKHWTSNGHSETSSVNGGAGSAALRTDAEAGETNGSSSPEPEPQTEPEHVNGDWEEPAPAERTPSGESTLADAEPGADVFQQVYESAVAEAI